MEVSNDRQVVSNAASNRKGNEPGTPQCFRAARRKI